VDKIEDFLKKLKNLENNDIKNKKDKLVKALRVGFYKELDNDFNTPKAFAVLFEFIKKVNELINKNQISKKQAGEIYNFFQEINEIFGIINFEKVNKAIPAEIKKLAKQREEYRAKKDWQKADQARLEMEKRGFTVEDTKQGPAIKTI
jgi:cysteinyl-tRNA synthetase